MLLLAVLVGGVFLQIHLSKKENKWLGLILPIITLAISVMVVARVATFTQVGHITYSEYVDGELVTTVTSEAGNRELIPGAIGGVIYTFLFMNIPTIVLFIIYKAVRSKKNCQRDICTGLRVAMYKGAATVEFTIAAPLFFYYTNYADGDFTAKQTLAEAVESNIQF